MRVGRAAGWVAVLLSAVGPMAGAASAAPAHTTRVDVSTGGVVANTAPDDAGIAMSANGDSFGPLAISGDGRFVAFESDSSNLAPGSACVPGQGGFCLFIRDRLHHTTRVVKRIVNPGALALSEHGRYLVASGIATPLERIDLHTDTAVVVSCCGLGDDIRNLQFDGMSANASLVAFALDPGAPDPDRDQFQVYVRNIARPGRLRPRPPPGHDAPHRSGAARAGER